KIHPLWYSEFIPILFFVSSIFAGLSMVIFEGSISYKVFSDQIDEEKQKKRYDIVHNLAKICTMTMFIYFFLQVVNFVHGKNLEYLNTRMGYWFLVEMIGFVLLPMAMFFYSYRRRNILLIKVAAIVTILGIVINRLNVSIIGYNWDAVNQYYPSWMEVVVSLTIIIVEIWVFRWVIRRMPVLREPPSWVKN
ncbi:MAG: polysulfide reductase NrfD, partial [Bacteroidales bacterium]|nr:polysulfide reductase NrfD [Bacteroidales bacterium]